VYFWVHARSLEEGVGYQKICVGPDQYNNEGGDGGRSNTDNKK